MSPKIVQLNFKFDASTAEYEQTVSGLVPEFLALPGLRWKIWLMNQAQNEAGGICLFDDDMTAEFFLEGPLAAQFKSHPAVSELSAKQFDVMEDITAMTRGPLRAAASA